MPLLVGRHRGAAVAAVRGRLAVPDHVPDRVARRRQQRLGHALEGALHTQVDHQQPTVVGSGRIRLHLPIDAKARDDFTFLVGTAPPPSPEPP